MSLCCTSKDILPRAIPAVCLYENTMALKSRKLCIQLFSRYPSFKVFCVVLSHSGSWLIMQVKHYKVKMNLLEIMKSWSLHSANKIEINEYNGLCQFSDVCLSLCPAPTLLPPALTLRVPSVGCWGPWDVLWVDVACPHCSAAWGILGSTCRPVINDEHLPLEKQNLVFSEESDNE